MEEWDVPLWFFQMPVFYYKQQFKANTKFQGGIRSEEK